MGLCVRLFLLKVEENQLKRFNTLCRPNSLHYMTNVNTFQQVLKLDRRLMDSRMVLLVRRCKTEIQKIDTLFHVFWRNRAWLQVFRTVYCKVLDI